MPRTPKKPPKRRAGPKVIRTVAALHEAVARFRANGDKVALVPTMGALHAGHLALARAARRRARYVVVSKLCRLSQTL